jgi:folate-binding protein YgfZ
MSVLTSQERLAAAGARLGDYRGAPTPATFGDTAAELRAFLESCALLDLGWQAKLVLTGEDRVRWLNGMVTNNVRDLAPGHGGYSFVLLPQGKIQADIVSYNRGDHLLVTTEQQQVTALKDIFDRYIIMDDVEVTDISDKLASVGVAGPKALETLAAAGIDARELAPGQVSDSVWREMGISVARSSLPALDGYEIWVAGENAERLWDGLVAAGAKPVGSDALEMLRIARGVPRFGIDLRSRDLPQETGQLHALNFAKGCYVGQEIVERIRSRAIVHRTFAGFEIQPNVSSASTSADAAAPSESALPAAGEKVSADGKDVGEITSVARVPFPSGERILALGYLRREIAPGTTVHIGALPATVRALPFSK